MTSDARREPAGGLPSDQPAAKLTDKDKRNGRPLTVNDSEVLILDAELEALLGDRVPTTQAALTDAERLAVVLVDTFGPTWSRRLASEILDTADDIAPHRPWGGAQ